MNILFFLIPKEKVQYVTTNMTIRQVLEKMKVHRYSSIPLLTKEGLYYGSISEGDLLNYISEHELDFETLEDINILAVERYRNYKSISINNNIEDLIDLSMEQNFVPVIDDYKTFIGIVTRKDIIMYIKNKNIK